MCDCGFSGFPAKKDGTSAAQRRKVEKAEVDIFHDAAIGLDAIDRAHDFRLEFGRSARFAAAFGGGCAGTPANVAQRRILLEQLDRKLAPLDPQLFDQGREHGDEGVGFFGRKETHARALRQSLVMQRFVVVAGSSGAGASQALKSFEDLGYHTLDNLPPALACNIVTLATHDGIDRIALSLDVRTGGAFGDALSALDAIAACGVEVELLFLDASDDALVRRYSETRRRHPTESGSLAGAIARERVALEPLRDRANAVWDTTGMTLATLKTRIFATYGDDVAADRFAVYVIAFGFKHGVPLDADLVFDVRFFPNPYYVPELRDLTGLDAAVAAFMEAQPVTVPFLERLWAFVDFLIPLYRREGKSRVTIAIGCTGGRHRSVYIARRLAQHLEQQQLVVECDLREAVGA